MKTMNEMCDDFENLQALRESILSNRLPVKVLVEIADDENTALLTQMADDVDGVTIARLKNGNHQKIDEIIQLGLRALQREVLLTRFDGMIHRVAVAIESAT